MTGQAAVEMPLRLVARATLLEQLFDEIDSAARPVTLVAEFQVCRTGRVAETAVNTAAQDRLGQPDVRVVCKLRMDSRLHRYIQLYSRPGLNNPSGSNAAFRRW